jgi:hypothetical protein
LRELSEIHYQNRAATVSLFGYLRFCDVAMPVWGASALSNRQSPALRQFLLEPHLQLEQRRDSQALKHQSVCLFCRAMRKDEVVDYAVEWRVRPKPRRPR